MRPMVPLLVIGNRSRAAFAATVVMALALATGPTRASGATIFASSSKLVASEAGEDFAFGTAMDTDGDTLVVGAADDDALGNLSGAVYVFVRSGADWVEVQQLTASDGTVNDHFGASVALDGDVLVVGAPWDDGPYPGTYCSTSFDRDCGSAYVFVRSGGVWSEQARLIPQSTSSNREVGRAVGVSGNVAVVGTVHGGLFENTGAVYTFVWDGAVWSEQEPLYQPDAAVGDAFSASLDLDGDTLLVGASLDDGDPPLSQAGSAYVFRRVAGDWIFETELLASDRAIGDTFGVLVDLDGDTAIIGATGVEADSPAPFGTGAAYVFVRSGESWLEQAELVASDGQQNDILGSAVAISGDVAIVAARQDDDACPTLTDCNSGAAYRFVRSGSTWIEEAKLVAADAEATDELGKSVAISGDTLFAAAWHDDALCPLDVDCNSGSVYLFIPEPTGLALGVAAAATLAALRRRVR